VRDKQAGAPGGQLLQGLQDVALRLAVQGAGRLVAQQDGRLLWRDSAAQSEGVCRV
jgi:hypothetical protein